MCVRRLARMLPGIACITIALSACGAARPASDSLPTLARAGNLDPLAGHGLYVAPYAPAAQQIALLNAQGDTRDAQLIERIAKQPAGTWFANDNPLLLSDLSALLGGAAAQGKLALIVAYYIPQRDCGGGYSAGGAATPSAYLRWIGRLAAGIGATGHGAIVILEPDAIPGVLAGCIGASAGRTRLALLRQAVALLKHDAGVVVYLDAGNAGWIKPVARLVAPLRDAGVAQADGFALNVANFRSTAASIAYGNELARALHGAHFVIDTGRNGNGADTNPADRPTWCNPPGRALGQTPSTNTGQPGVDAYLWVKRPGDSDGTCRPGAPPAGHWWPQYALQLAAAKRR
jgi:endoglucanase